MEVRLPAATTAHLRASAPFDELALDSAFEAMYRRTWPRVYSFVRCHVGDRATAQELACRAFFKAYRNRHRRPAGLDDLLWILRIAHNVVIDHWRVEGRRTTVTISLDELGDLAGTTADPEVAALTRERQAMLVRLMGDLDHSERSLLAMKFAAQRTNREISAVLSISEGAVSMRLLRALRRLREQLQKAGV
jgi:RNA polymerase sigma-70 factor (ECF subfamily)